MFSLWSLLTTIFSGLVVGLIACMIMGDGNGGWIKYILIGIVGSALGSFICRIIGIYAYGTLVSLAVNIAGSCLLIWLIRKMGYE